MPDPQRKRRVAAPIATALIDRPAPNLGGVSDAVTPQPTAPPLGAAPSLAPSTLPPPGLIDTVARPPVRPGFEPTPIAPGTNPVDLLINRTATAPQPSIETASDLNAPAAPGALSGYGPEGAPTPEAAAAYEVPDERGGFGRTLGRTVLGLLAGGGNAALAEATGIAGRARVDEKRRLKAAEYRQQHQDAQQAEDDAFTRQLKQQQAELNRQRIAQGEQPEYVTTSLGEGEYVTTNKSTGQATTGGKLRPPKVDQTPGRWERIVDEDGDVKFYNPDTGETKDSGQRTTPTGTGKADALAGYKARSIDEHMQDETGYTDQQVSQMLHEQDVEIGGIDEQIKTLTSQQSAAGDDDEAKARYGPEIQRLQKLRDDRRAARDKLASQRADARKAYNADVLREKEHPAAKTPAPKYTRDPDAAKQKLIELYGSWEQVPQEKRDAWRRISGRSD